MLASRKGARSIHRSCNEPSAPHRDRLVLARAADGLPCARSRAIRPFNAKPGSGRLDLAAGDRDLYGAGDAQDGRGERNHGSRAEPERVDNGNTVVDDSEPKASLGGDAAESSRRGATSLHSKRFPMRTARRTTASSLFYVGAPPTSDQRARGCEAGANHRDGREQRSPSHTGLYTAIAVVVALRRPGRHRRVSTSAARTDRVLSRTTT